MVLLDRAKVEPSGLHRFFTLLLDLFHTGLECILLIQLLLTALMEGMLETAQKSSGLLHGLDIADWQPEFISITFNISFILHGLEGWKVNFPDFLATRLMNVIEILPVRW